MKTIRTSLIKHIVVFLILGYYGSITFFSHTHDIGGRSITHSHLYNPFSESRTQHTHTENEILFIAILSQLIAYVGVAILLYGVFIKSIAYFRLGRITPTVSIFSYFESNGLRAPPR